MVNTLKELANKYDFLYKEEDGTYNLSFNIRNLPTKRITLEKAKENYKITANCTFLWGTSKTPSILSGNTPDQYRCQVTCHFMNKDIPFNFHVLESGFFSKLAGKSDFKVKCKDKFVYKLLSENPSIKALYAKCNESAELSPSIDCKTKENTTILEINFQTFDSHIELVNNSINLCQEVMKFTET